MTAKDKGDNKEHIGGPGDHLPIHAPDGRMDLTKSGKAYQIFDEMHKKDAHVARKDCLDRAVAEAGMTPASAATFYQKWRDDNGMVHRGDEASGSNNTQPVEITQPTIKNSAGHSEPATAEHPARSSPSKH